MKRTKNILSLIGQSSRGTISAMQDMIWSIQPNKDTMKDLIDRMREYAYPLAELKNVKLIFTIEKEVQNLTISMENRKNIYLIFKEAVNNAFKYSSAGGIYLFPILALCL
jgi:signal transduction histidine kinase